MSASPPDRGADGSAPRWQVRYPLGRTDATRSMGTVAAPMLAGFALASAIVLVTAGRQPPLTGPALVGFAVAAAFLLFCVQLTHTGLLYSAAPADRLAVLADPNDPEQLARAARIQHADTQLQDRYFRRARACYDLGVLALLAALTVAVVPPTWTPWRIVTVAALAVAIATEACWVAAGWLGRRPRWLLPSYRHVRTVLEEPHPTDQHQQGGAQPAAESGQAEVWGSPGKPFNGRRPTGRGLREAIARVLKAGGRRPGP